MGRARSGRPKSRVFRKVGRVPRYGVGVFSERTGSAQPGSLEAARQIADAVGSLVGAVEQLRRSGKSRSPGRGGPLLLRQRARRARSPVGRSPLSALSSDTFSENGRDEQHETDFEQGPFGS
jgi:hypothetical protein